MNIKIWDLNEDMEEISMKDAFLDEKVIDDVLEVNRKIDVSELSGYCEEIMVHNLKTYTGYAEKHEDKYAVSFTVGFGPVKEVMDNEFYHGAWKVFKEKINSLPRLFNLSSWRIGKGILDRNREDILIIECSGHEYPLWEIYFSLTSTMTYRKVMEMAKILEKYFKDQILTIDKNLK